MKSSNLHAHPLILVAFALFASSASRSAEPCEQRSELQCISATDCTLHQIGPPGSKYECRDAANACEQGFRQKSGTPEECEAKPGCVFVPQNCYCAPDPDVVCRCGGGPPSQCRPKPATRP
jgi:hypothetical protein